MIVRQTDFDTVVAFLSDKGEYAVDCETTGLRANLGDRLFSVIIATDTESYYFNFKTYDGLAPEWVLPRSWIPELSPALSNPDSLYFLHNAKFDMAMLAREGLYIQGRVHCTEAIARLLYNRHMTYKLDACAKRIGLEKSTAVDEYIKKNKLFTVHTLDTGKTVKQPHFDRVPFHIISEYGMQDGRITYALGTDQESEIIQIENTTPSIYPSIRQVYENELAVTKTCFAIEQQGIRVDTAYCKKAYVYEITKSQKASQDFELVTGEKFIDSAEPLARAFTKLGETFPRTKPTKTRPNGTPSFTDDVLQGFTNPLAKLLITYRESTKKANAYYANFLKYSDANGRIYANIRQSGTLTGRFSITEPALQTLSKEEDVTAEYSVRRAFIPTEDFCFFTVDYDQQEFRLMLDCAAEMPVISRILSEGLDVHQATADQMGVTRSEAKTLNFLLLYGGGAEKLAAALGISTLEATALKQNYFRALPNVDRWIKAVVEKAEKHKVLINWYGRRCHFPYINPDVNNVAYAGPNHIIQGGCGDVMRVAMNRIADYLQDKKSRMVLTIHDEIIFELHKSELDIAPALVMLMERAYPHRHLPLTCSPSYSWKSWADKEKGLPK